ncbi:MAG: hypothetical protein IPG85_18305 [Bacteroidetes bacterium]|nr:hypothetical protein [Bacteroidota bacterium]
MAIAQPDIAIIDPLEICQDGGVYIPNISFGLTGGTYTGFSPSGLNMNLSTGEIFPNSALPDFMSLHITLDPTLVLYVQLMCFLMLSFIKKIRQAFLMLLFAKVTVYLLSRCWNTRGHLFFISPGGLSIDEITGVIDLEPQVFLILIMYLIIPPLQDLLSFYYYFQVIIATAQQHLELFQV